MMRGFDINSNDNTLYATGRCNNRCIFCCEPPVAREDADAIWVENMRLLQSAPDGVPVVGISGGEPALLGERLVKLIEAVVARFPHADVHLLTNGRAFSNLSYTRSVVQAARGRLVAGVPLHSDYSGDHDMIAGARGAFNETVAGICNLAAAGAVVELRVVINSYNYTRVRDMALFVHRNLPFVALTAFMAMERVGLAAENASGVWMESSQYSRQLAQAVAFLETWHHPVAIYNVPLCLLEPESRHHACRSISNWKQRYLPECDRCELKAVCCGLFATSAEPFSKIRPICSTT
ncbi:MAG: His-Xaa-Ser system radical SAM maturase HxsC [Muribaculaceae bacterium]|nr:His-Xaa-Ser system radical SAM maturase HxsC [Muribaculaceae bacterium]